MDPDIPRVEADPTPPSRITLHHLQSDATHERDARIAGTGISPLSTVILDFMYGVAAYRRWGTGGQDIDEVMQQRFSSTIKISLYYQPLCPQVVAIVPRNLMASTTTTTNINPIDDKEGEITA